MPEPMPQTPALDGLARPRGIRLAERRLGKIELRGDPADRAFMAAVGRTLDLLLPGEPNTTAGRGELAALWLGPDAWLLTSPPPQVAGHVAALRQALADVHAAVTEVSDGRVVLRLAGPSARDVLAKGCPLDLHPRAFAAGRCAQSLLAKASVLIHLVNDDAPRGPTFDLYVARSFAHYLFAWLEDAGREFGAQVGSPG
ncbi:MAG TPA: sarcosine oxidase subunit gamma family protein [Geminicoccaceae bacterium]|nr:sarcosine oxidase subunit gamma family protein [Geminicoccaceae bacterium]